MMFAFESPPASAFPVQLFSGSSTTADHPPIRLELGGSVYTRARQRKIQGNEATFSLDLTRARLGAELYYAELLKMKISAELSSGPELKDAYLEVRPLDVVALRTGQQKVPFGQLEWHSRWDLPVVSRGIITQQISRRLGFSDRRVGALIEGKAKLLPTKPRLELGVFQNGELSDRYDFAGRLRLRPFRGAEIDLAGYQRAAASIDGDSGHAGTLAFEYDKNKMLILVEGFLGRARRLSIEGPTVTDATFFAVRGLFGYKFKLGPAGAMPFVAAELLDPGLSTNSDRAFAIRGGVHLVLLKVLRLSVEVDHQTAQTAAVIPTSTTFYALLGARID